MPGADSHEPVVTKEMMLGHPVMSKMLNMQLFAVFSTAPGGLAPVLAQSQAHLTHQVEMERQGVMFAAGPLFGEDDSAWNGDGMFVIRAASYADAMAIAARDPMHQSGARTFIVRPWLLNEGSVSVRLELSSGTMRIS